jgi:hypothetical protein
MEKRLEMLELAAAIEAFRVALIARDAIDEPCFCGSAEWVAAHEKARVAACRKRAAYKAVYDAGLLPRPYWF